MAVEDLKTEEGWNQFIQRHHGFVSRELAKGQKQLGNGKIVTDDPASREIPPDQVKYRYTLGDGTTFDIDNLRNATNMEERAPSVATGTRTQSGEWTQTEYRDDPSSPGQEQKWGIDPADGVFKAMPGTVRPKQPKGAATGQLDRIDARGQVIPPTDTTTPVVKLRDPISNTVIDMPDPRTDPGGTLKEFGDDLLLIKPDGTFTRVASKPATGTKTTTFQGPDGSQWEYDPSKPAGQRASRLVAGKPEKPEVTNPNEIVWIDIPGTNSQQANRVVDGKPQVIEGYTKPKTTTMVGDAKSKKWSFLDAEGNVVRTVDNPGYVETKTTLSTPADQQYILQQNADGTTSQIENPNYRPKTTADVAARTGQLQSLMVAKGKELQDKYKDNPEEGVRQFHQWYDQNVQGQLASLQQAAEEANFTRAKEIADQRRQAFQQAQTAGTQAVQAYQASGLSRVGDRMAEVLNQASNQTNTKGINWQDAVVFNDSGPDSVGGRAAAASQKAFEDLSKGIPQYTPLAPGAELDRTRYMPSFAQAQAGPAAPAPPPPPPPAPVFGPRADQMFGTAPPNNEMAPTPGITGAVQPGSPVYLGTLPPTPEEFAAAAMEAPPPEMAMVAPMVAPVAYTPPRPGVPVLRPRRRPMPIVPQYTPFQTAPMIGGGGGTQQLYTWD